MNDVSGSFMGSGEGDLVRKTQSQKVNHRYYYEVPPTLHLRLWFAIYSALYLKLYKCWTYNQIIIVIGTLSFRHSHSFFIPIFTCTGELKVTRKAIRKKKSSSGVRIWGFDSWYDNDNLWFSSNDVTKLKSSHSRGFTFIFTPISFNSKP